MLGHVEPPGCSSSSADCRFATFAHVMTCQPLAAAAPAAAVRPAAVAGALVAAAGQFAVDVAEPTTVPNVVWVFEVCTLYVLWVVLLAVVVDVAVVVVVVVVVVVDTANFDSICTDGADDGFQSASYVVVAVVVVVVDAVVVDNTAAAE